MKKQEYFYRDQLLASKDILVDGISGQAHNSKCMTRGLQCSSLVLDETTENTFRFDDIHHITVPNFNTRLEGTNSHVRAGNYGRFNNDEK